MASPQTPVDVHRIAKKQFPGVLHFVRVGDFFETFGDDAETFSRVTGAAITTRNTPGKQPLKMAGIPCQSVAQYFPKLIAAGIRVSQSDWSKR